MTFPSLLLLLTHTLFPHTHTHTCFHWITSSVLHTHTHSTDDEILPQPQVLDRVPASVGIQLTSNS